MKHSVIIILLIAAAFAGCKNTEKQNEAKSPKEVVHEQESDLLSTAWMGEMQLSETTEGVAKMQELLKTQTTSSIEDYHQLANKLNEVKNNVVKECTMKGASHDNLHIWLYPLILKVEALSNTNDIKEASKLKQSIIENVAAYDIYFQ